MKMGRYVLDASALMAMLDEEPGGERVAAVLEEPESEVMISAVNLSEAHAKFVQRSIPGQVAWRLLTTLPLETIPFDADQAHRTGSLIHDTKKFGLSFGDRACIALGLSQQATILTADTLWKKLKLGDAVELVR